MYIQVRINGKNYKINMIDLIKVHTITKNRRPALPIYDGQETETKDKLITDFEYDAITMP